MAWKLVIAHAEGEEHLAERLSKVLSPAGYEVAHRGTVLVGESFTEEANKALAFGGPVVVCGTIKAVGTPWARMLLRNVESEYSDRVRIFPVRLEPGADLKALTGNVKTADCHKDFDAGINELLKALREYYPIEERAASTKHDSNKHWADHPTGLFYDEKELESFRKRLRPNILDLLPNTLNDHDFLYRAGLLAIDGSLTQAGALIVGKQLDLKRKMPEACVACARYDGVSRASKPDASQVHGPVPMLIRESLQFLTEQIGHREQPIPDPVDPILDYEYPMIAVREILANAFCHRKYDDENPRYVHVRLLVERIEVVSPGDWIGRVIGKHEKIEIDALITEPVRRNARLSNVLTWVSLVEEEGSGLPRAVEDCRTIGARLPTVESRNGYTAVLIWPRTGLRRSTKSGAVASGAGDPAFALNARMYVAARVCHCLVDKERLQHEDQRRSISAFLHRRLLGRAARIVQVEPFLHAIR